MSNLSLDALVAALQADPDKAKVATKAATEYWAGKPFIPLPGPQTAAYYSQADELFYGGEAGGGKTDLGIGLACNEHTASLFLRREREQVKDAFARCGDMLSDAEIAGVRRNGADLLYSIGDKTILFGGCQNEDDKQKHKGRPRDLYVFDEIGDFLRSQFQFIKAWNRSVKPGQRCRVLCTGNPPTTAEGLWVIEYWAAWLDPKHPNPAKDGELRWYASDNNGKEREFPCGGQHTIIHDDGTEEVVRASSRTFIRAGLKDNPYLMDTDYGARLDALPKELRAAYRDGRFDLALEDDPWQVIPTSWIMAAQKRWTPDPPQGVPMCSIGVDIAQGGADSTTLAPRYDGWYAPLVEVQGKDTPMPRDVVALIVKHRRDSALPILDMGGGYGGGVAEGLEDNDIKCSKYKGATASTAISSCKAFEFSNKRSEAYWRFREALDPGQPGGSCIMLPEDSRLLSDLTAAKYQIKRGTFGKMTLSITDKETLVKNLGRSPDKGDAVVMAYSDGIHQANIHGGWKAYPGNRPLPKTANLSARRTAGRRK